MFPAREIAEREKAHGVVSVRAVRPGVGEVIFRDGSVVQTGLCWSPEAPTVDLVQMASLLTRWGCDLAESYLLSFDAGHVGWVYQTQ